MRLDWLEYRVFDQVPNNATFIGRPWRTFEYWLRCFDRLHRLVARGGPSANSVATATVPTATVPTATVPTATMPTAPVPTATVPTAAVAATTVATARVSDTGVTRAVRAEMAYRGMSATRMTSRAVSTHEMSSAGVVPSAVGRRVPDGDSEVVSADEVMVHPVVPVRPVPQNRGPEVRKHSVPVVRGVVAGRIRASRDVYDAIVPLAARIRSLQQIANDLVADALLPEPGDRVRVELEPDLAGVEEDEDRLIRNIAPCQQC